MDTRMHMCPKHSEPDELLIFETLGRQTELEAKVRRQGKHL